MMDKAPVLSYFADKAAAYDDVDLQKYWVLSDRLLWWFFENRVLPGLPAGLRLLDAGAGTGRWSDRLLAARPEATARLVDLSPEMLAEAERKLVRRSPGRFTIDNLDLDKVDELGSFDLVICLHNVLGFVADPARVMDLLVRSVAPGGTLVVATPNWYHAMYFSLSVADVELAGEIHRTKQARFNRQMPPMHSFTPDELRAMASGMERADVFGFPVTIYPGMEETRISGETESLSSLLDDPGRTDRILELETSVCTQPDAAGRGNQLLLIARKGAGSGE